MPERALLPKLPKLGVPIGTLVTRKVEGLSNARLSRRLLGPHSRHRQAVPAELHYADVLVVLLGVLVVEHPLIDTQ